MHRLNSFLLLLGLMIGSVAVAELPQEEADGSPDERLVALLSAIDSLHARYDQHAAGPGVQTGEIWLRKPGMFRVESGPPLSQTVVSDGQSLWTWDRDLEQVIISDMDKASGEIPVLLFAGNPDDIPEHYTVDFFQDEKREHFLLQPKIDTGMLTALALTFESGAPTTIVVENALQQRTTIRLFDVDAVDLAREDLFVFTPPAHVDIIDDRQQ